MSQKIRVAIVEDFLPLLHSLKEEISQSEGLTCVGAYELCEEALAAMPKMKADVVLMDLGLPRMDGFECTRQMKEKWPRVKVLVFSATDTDEAIITAFGAGVDGYLVKETNRHELADAIKQAFRSEWPMSRRVRQTTAVYLQWRQRMMPVLSPRERQIFDLLEQGRSRKEIADKLKISSETVKTHIERILEKSNASSSKEAGYLRKHVAAA